MTHTIQYSYMKSFTKIYNIEINLCDLYASHRGLSNKAEVTVMLDNKVMMYDSFDSKSLMQTITRIYADLEAIGVKFTDAELYKILREIRFLG